MAAPTAIGSRLLLVCIFLSAVGCASIKVTKITPGNDATIQGIRYYLPKPFIQVTPQADGTMAVDVIYLPDKDHKYAINTSSHLSAFTF